MNEPFAGGGDKKPGDWYSGKPFGGYDFLQWIALDLAAGSARRSPELWIKRLSAAIREHDRRHLITVGLLPWVPGWGHLSGFIPETVAPELDFISVHIYPEKGKVDDAIVDPQEVRRRQAGRRRGDLRPHLLDPGAGRFHHQVAADRLRMDGALRRDDD